MNLNPFIPTFRFFSSDILFTDNTNPNQPMKNILTIIAMITLIFALSLLSSCRGHKGDRGIVENFSPHSTNMNVSDVPQKGITFGLNSYDTEGDAITFIIKSNPSKGNVALLDANTGSVTYTPRPGESGDDSFTFSAKETRDGGREGNTATVFLRILVPGTGGGGTKPEANFTAVVNGLKVDFNASFSKGVGLSYSFDFGDGTFRKFSTENKTTHTYAMSGRYEVTLWVVDSGNNLAKKMLPVSVSSGGGGGGGGGKEVPGSGNVLRANSFGGTGEDSARCVTATFDGGFIVAGVTFSSELRFGSRANDVVNGSSLGVAYWTKFDKDGKVVWTRTLPSGSHNANKIIAVNEGFIVAGMYKGEIRLDQSWTLPSYSNAGQAFVIVYSDAGQVMWARPIGGGGSSVFGMTKDSITDIAVSDNTLYLVGEYEGVARFGGSIKTLLNGGRFIASYNMPDGMLNWVMKPTDAYAHSVCVRKNGQLVVGGFDITMYLSNGSFVDKIQNRGGIVRPLSNGGFVVAEDVPFKDSFLACYNTSGEEVWSAYIGRVSMIDVYGDDSIAVNPSGMLKVFKVTGGLPIWSTPCFNANAIAIDLEGKVTVVGDHSTKTQVGNQWVEPAVGNEKADIITAVFK